MEDGGCIPSNIPAAYPPIFSCPTSANVMTFFFWSSLHFGQDIGHLGSDNLFFLTSFWAKNRASARVCQIIPPNLMTFFFWSSLHFGQDIGHLGSDNLFFLTSFWAKNRASARVCQIIPPNLEKWQKIVNFAESSPQCST